MKLNNAKEFEPIHITLTSQKYPKAFKNKVDELMEEGAFDNRADAEKFVSTTPIECEVYYEKGKGLFVVESDACECGLVYSPYTAEHCEEPTDN